MVKDIKAQNFFNYFKDCYELDNSVFIVDNILATKYPYKWFAKKQENLLNGYFSYTPYFNKKVDELKKEITLYTLDKQLYYAAFLILGKNENHLIKDKKFCAPLVLFPASIEKEDKDYFLRINQQEAIINKRALNAIELNKNIASTENFVNECYEYFSKVNQDAFTLKRLVEKTFTNIDTSELDWYPKVWNDSKIRAYFRNTTLESGVFKIVPAAGSIFLNKTNASQKVVTDLEGIAKQDLFNIPIKELLNGTNSKKTFSNSYLESKLNKDQFKALQNSTIYNNSIIIGPPGTGKTYTISNIVVDAILKNKSVLVVSKTKAAVEVLRNVLSSEFNLKNSLVHTSGRGYKNSLKRKIKRHLSGITKRVSKEITSGYISQLSHSLKRSENEFSENIEKELQFNELFFKEGKTIIEYAKYSYLDLLSNFNSKYWESFFQIERKNNLLQGELKSFIISEIRKQINQNASNYREDLSNYYNALVLDTFSEYKKQLEKVDIKNILKVFPVWLAHLPELNAVVAQEKDLFDIVIIDEATQCDIASALPAIYRAKQVVIAGDPNQLKHYSFVSKKKQLELQDDYQLPKEAIFDYRNRSILDFYIAKVTSQDQVSFLREHYRSTPSIIDFSNQQFYDNQLEIIKSTPEHTQTSQLYLKNVYGNRDKNGTNKVEADAIIAQLKTFIKQFEKITYPPTIGIISFFSNQVAYINTLLKDEFGLNTLKRFNILCGTAYQFQGSERDIILFSTVVDANTHHSALHHANKPEVLNVAITRAKSEQYIYTSISKTDIPQDSLLSKYLYFVESYNYADKIAVEYDTFQEEVVSSLKNKGYNNCICGYPVAGAVLDILVLHKNKKYFIDLIGFPGQHTDAFSLERYKTFSRIGIFCFPLHYSFWRKQPQKSLEQLLLFLEKL